MQLRIGIAGAGIGGLAAAIALSRLGHLVTVYEAASALAQIGAGIQLTPNASKLLIRWGVQEFLPDLLNNNPCFKVRRWQDGKIIGRMNTPTHNVRFGGPYVQVHRADLQQALLRVAYDLGVVVLTNSRVVDYDFERPALVLKGGQTIVKDFILAADGVRSCARSKIKGCTDEPTIPTGLAVFRAAIESSQLAAIPDLAHLVSDTGVNLWVGPQRHAVAYAMSGDSLVNLVLEYPESRPAHEWITGDYLLEIESLFDGWDPSLTKMLSMIQSPLKWPLHFSVPLQTWSSGSGKVLLMGDAAHVVPSFLAQGAAMAIEDAALLAKLFTETFTTAGISEMSRKFQDIRLSRRLRVEEVSLHNLHLYHLQDGHEQAQRDNAHNTNTEYSPIWNDTENQTWLYGYDAAAAAAAASTSASSTSVVSSNKDPTKR